VGARGGGERFVVLDVILAFGKSPSNEMRHGPFDHVRIQEFTLPIFVVFSISIMPFHSCLHLTGCSKLKVDP